jgi:hypothetical protein
MKRWAVTTFDFYRSKTDDSALMGYIVKTTFK